MKTTYLMGAGASAKALPCIAGIEENIDEMFKFLGLEIDSTAFYIFPKSDREDYIIPPTSLQKEWKNLYYHRGFIMNELKKHLSIDTAAKILYGLDNKNYNLLKAILIAAFVYWEKRSAFDNKYIKLDNRYQNFWATIMKTKREQEEMTFRGFPKNINFLTWNYDNQVKDSLEDLFSYTNWSGSKRYVDDITSKNKSSDNEAISLIKLNGTAGFKTEIDYKTAHQRTSPPTLKEQIEDFKKFVGSIILFSDKYAPNFDLRFSWERNDFNQNRDINCALKKVNGTTNLVVIGYTFPTLNLEIDSKLISEMIPTLNTVYFQGKDYDDSVRIMRYFENTYSQNFEFKKIPVDHNGFFIPQSVFQND